MADNDKQKRILARRSLLKSVVAGGGILASGRLLPESWTRPVVQSVMLPAHAQTSPPVPTGGFGAAADSLTFNDPGRSILDYFVQPAHAQPFDAQVGNVAFSAYWTVREDDAEICGQAVYVLSDATASLSASVGRSGDSLDRFTQGVGPVTLEFTNQQVSEGGVSLTASTTDPGNPSKSLIAPPSAGCGGNVVDLKGTSSPYAEDEEIV